jgi:hypothetical protein
VIQPAAISPNNLFRRQRDNYFFEVGICQLWSPGPPSSKHKPIFAPAVTNPEPPDSDPHDDCVIPHAVEPEALERYLLKRDAFDGAADIRSYVEDQSPEETVTYLECINTERVMGTDYEVWDVHTSGERYWVLTNPTNLYAQRLFPSADYTLSFHIGLSARVMARREARADEERRARLMAAWRRWTQAAEALDEADEAEDFQAVGMRCRECLLTFVREVATDEMVPNEEEGPKSGDFVHWSELIANAVVAGSSLQDLRSYLKANARSTWQLVSWLTHASGANRLDAEIALEATHGVLAAFSTAIVRFERGAPARCPYCGSCNLGLREVEVTTGSWRQILFCRSCGASAQRLTTTALGEPGSGA